MRTRLILLLLVLLNVFSIKAQNYTTNLSSSAVAGPSFTTYNEMMNPATTTNQVTVQLQRPNNTTSIASWRLTVRLTQDYTYNTNTVAAENSYLTYNSQTTTSGGQIGGISTNPFQLNKSTEVTLINSNTALNSNTTRTFRFNLTVLGGNHMLNIPNGTYNSAYEFKLYRIVSGNAILVSTNTAGVANSARFSIDYDMNAYGVTLQNGANIYNLNFNTAADYANGKSVEVTNGLRITSGIITDYQLAIKASGNFISGTSSSTIPINVLRAQLTPASDYGGVNVTSPVTLSTSEQIVVSRTWGWIFWNSTFNFDLRFYIPPGASGLNVPAGTYTTYVYFILMPN